MLFASEIKSLLEVSDVPRELDHNAIDEYLTYQYIPHPNTVFQGIHKLPPAHFAVFQDGDFSIKRYWQPSATAVAQSESEAEQKLCEALEDSVKLRMQSDVPLGAFLSGGMDSSIIVALMQKLSDDPIRTFSIGFPSRDYDETEYARQVADHLQTKHQEFRLESTATEILDRLVWHFDEPFADSSAIPTWFVSKLTREHVTVALTGDGGDELFLGYPRYRAVRMASRFDKLPKLLRRFVSAKFWQCLPSSSRQKSKLRQMKRFLEAVRMSPSRRYVDWISIFNERRRAELYTDEFLSCLTESDPAAFVTSAWQRTQQSDTAATAGMTDLVTYLPCDLMTKVDIASMAHGLECRQPFLDHRLVELAINMPAKFRFRRGRGKRILWNTFGHLLPKSIGKRPKMGFGVPLEDWFRNDLKQMALDTLLDQQTSSRGYFHTDTIRRLIDEHIQGTFDHSSRLWSLLVFEMWCRKWNV